MAKKKKPAAKNPEVTRLAEDASRFLKEDKNRHGSVETIPSVETTATEAPNSNLLVPQKPVEKKQLSLFRRVMSAVVSSVQS